MLPGTSCKAETGWVGEAVGGSKTIQGKRREELQSLLNGLRKTKKLQATTSRIDFLQGVYSLK